MDFLRPATNIKPILPDFVAPPRADIVPAGNQRPSTVSEVVSRLKRLIERNFIDVHVEGEISGYRPAASGHVYFTLKDQGAVLSCVLWKADAARVKPVPKDGDTVEIRGCLSMYEQRGQCQLVVQSIKPAGLGKLYLAFQEMKERLQAEGLFDLARKRPIPLYPKRIGVVTSPSGAAIRDILQILSRRAPHIEVFIWPARVQGQGAAQEVAHGITAMNALAMVDVLIVGRGGGSMEDLWCFNEEIVARAIFQSKIPVISAVGHETDTSISDFVADLRTPTPSAAAELVAKNSADLIRELDHVNSRLHGAVRRRTEFLRQVPHLRSRLESMLLSRISIMKSNVRRFEDCHALKRPLQKVNEMRQRLDDVDLRLERGLTTQWRNATQRLSQFEAQMRALDPKAIMNRGYSITFDPHTGQIIRREIEASAGQPLRVLLAEGKLDVNVAGAAPASRAPKRRRKVATDPEWFGFFNADGTALASTGE